GHWDLADKYLTERYIQHNPNAASGRAGVVQYFTEVRKVKPLPIPEKMKTKVVSVVADGDLVVVAYVRQLKDAEDSSTSYTTTWFDTWRFRDGKADEHWDPATRIGRSSRAGRGAGGGRRCRTRRIWRTRAGAGRRSRFGRKPPKPSPGTDAGIRFSTARERLSTGGSRAASSTPATTPSTAT